MHELGITRNIVAIVCEQAGDRRVKRVTVDIGKLSAVMPEAIRFCFDICCQQTPLEGAQLDIREIDGRGRCRSCGAEVPLDHPFGSCQCGSRDVECIAGTELMIKEMEVF